MPRSARGPGEGSIRHRADGRWEATITIGSLEGKQVRRSAYAKTRKEALQLLTQLRAARDAQRLPRPGDPKLTVAAFLARWLEDIVKPRREHSTYRTYEGQIRLHLVPALGDLPLVKLQPADVQRLMVRCQQAGLAPKTVQALHSTLRTALRQAVRWGLLERNVASSDYVEPVAVRPPKRKALSLDEAHAIQRVFAGDRLEALYVLALASGLRVSEALGLCWSDLDLEQRTLSLQHQLARRDGQWELKQLKTRAGQRELVLPAIAIDALRAHRAAQLAERLKAGAAWANPLDLVFTMQDGRPVTRGWVTERMQSALKRAGLAPLSFHGLRHGAASLGLAQGTDLKTLSEQLGHSTIRITADLYAHVGDSLKAEAARRMDQALRPPQTLEEPAQRSP